MMPADFHRGWLVTVDPGLRGLGLAACANGVLMRACYVKNSGHGKPGGPPAHTELAREAASVLASIIPIFGVAPALLCRVPASTAGLKTREIDPNDLLDVAGVASACTAAFVERRLCAYIELPAPSRMEGHHQKRQMTARIEKQLTAPEASRIVRAGSKDHNTLDAVGIALYKLRRLNQRVYS